MSKIAFDLDGVLAQFNPLFDKFVFERYGLTIQNKDSWDMAHKYAAPEEVLINAFHIFTRDAKWLEIQRDLGWLHVLNTCHNRGNDTSILTSRGVNKHDQMSVKHSVRLQTYQWIAENLNPGVFTSIVFAHDKINYCLRNDITHLVDDKPAYYQQAIAKVTPSILRVIVAKRDWNSDIPEEARLTSEEFFEKILL